MKKVLIILLFVFICLGVYADKAVDTYFTPFESNFSVDLASEEYDGAKNGNYYDPGGTGDYTDKHLIGVLGVTGRDGTSIAGTYQLTFDLLDYNGNILSDSKYNWMYRSLKDPTKSIPFGIDLVVRYSKAGEEQKTGKTSGIVSVGSYRDSDQRIGNVSNTDNDKGKITSYIRGTSTIIEIETGEKWNAFWIDVVLVLPTETRKDLADKGDIQVFGANDYQAAFRIQVNGQIDEDGNQIPGGAYTVYMNGYYGTEEPDSSGSVIFTVNPNAAATNINLSSMNPGDSISIGSYYYSTKGFRNKDFYSPNAEGDLNYRPFKMFVSSSDDPNTGGDMFYLKHVYASAENTSAALNIPFKIMLASDDYLVGNKTFSGNGSYSGSNGNDNLLVGNYEFEISRQGEDFKVYTWADQGDIYFILDESVQMDELVSGYYTSNIYIHLVIDL